MVETYSETKEYLYFTCVSFFASCSRVLLNILNTGPVAHLVTAVRILRRTACYKEVNIHHFHHY